MDAPTRAAVIRPVGWNATSESGMALLRSMRRPGHFYRGMTNEEYEATVGRGMPVMSTGAYSYRSEGTSFAEDPEDAESYVNFGRDDPRITGRPTWLVEVAQTPSMKRDRDGYTKSREPVDTITRVWRMDGKKGKIVASEVYRRMLASLGGGVMAKKGKKCVRFKRVDGVKRCASFGAKKLAKRAARSTAKKRRSPTRGWDAAKPKTQAERRRVAAKCPPSKCFGDPKELKYPMCSKQARSCGVDCRGAAAAFQRARQHKRVDVQKRVLRAAKKSGCAWVKTGKVASAVAKKYGI